MSLLIHRFDATLEEIMQRVMMPNTPDSEVLWGGEKGPGLVYVVAELTKTVAQLASSVADLTKVVSGNEGLQAQVTRLVNDANDREEKVRARIDHLWQVGIPVAAAMILGVLGLVIRAAQVATTHHL